MAIQPKIIPYTPEYMFSLSKQEQHAIIKNILSYCKSCRSRGGDPYFCMACMEKSSPLEEHYYGVPIYYLKKVN